MKDKKLADFLSFNTDCRLRNLVVEIKEKTMATRTNKNATYYISPAHLTFVENSGYGVNLIQVSASSSCYITVFDPDNGVMYNVDSGYQKWKIAAYNNKFPDDKPEYLGSWNIYVRLERTGASALIVYDQRDRAFSGGIITKNENGESVVGAADPSYYYVKLGVVGPTDGVSIIRTITYDTGMLNTPASQNAAWDLLNAMFVPHYDDLENPDVLTWIEAKSHMGVVGGVTMYADSGSLNIPSIYDGLPIDNNTLKRDENGVLMLNPDIDLGGGIDEEGLKAFLIGEGYATQSWVEGKKYITGVTSSMVTAALGYTPLKTHQAIYALIIQKNGDDVGTYTPNSEPKTINIAVPTKVGELVNDKLYATTSDVDARITNLINGAPAAYDTLKEIADVLQGNVNSIGDIITTLGTKADKVIKISAGAGLSGGGTLESDRTLSLDTSGVAAGTYKSVTVDKYGRVTNGSNPTTLSGYGITDAYTKSSVDTLLGNYVTLSTKQDITGEKNFKGGLKVNGSPIVYDSTNKYWKLEGDLLVTGGISMYSNDSAFSPSTVMDGVVVDGLTIGKNPTSGALEFIGSINGGIASSVDWENVENKPLWIGSSKPVYSWNEITSKPTFAAVATSGKYSDLIEKPDLSVYALQTSLANYQNKITSTNKLAYSLISGTPTLLSSFTNDLGFITSYVDTKNTAGSTDTSSKIFLIGATSQSVNPQTYSHDTAYVGTDGCLYSGNAKVLTAHQTIYNLTMQAGAFSAVTFDPNGAAKTVNIPTTTSHISEGDNLYYTNARAQAAITGGASTIATSNLTASRALVSNSSGKVAVSAVTSTELGYLVGVTSAIQTQLDAKLASASYTAADVLTKLKTVDGSDSGLDADLLDGTHKSDLLTAASSSSATNLSITVGGTTKNITDLYAYKATELETARTIWGQSFNGTKNISGALSGATTGSFSSNVTIGGTLGVTGDTTLGKKLTLNGIPIYKSQDGVLYIDGNLAVTGGITMYSDIRKKTKLQDVELTLQQIADAPLIEHYYNSDEMKTTHVGSIAQYWASMNDWFCKLDSEGYYTMEIQNCALASAISIARELDRYESKTDKTINKLKKKIALLEEEVEQLRSRL